MKGEWCFMAALAAACAFGGTAHAEEGGHSPDYPSQAGRKLGRGIANTALGWAELPAGIEDIGKKHGVGAAATLGVIHGVGRTVQRTAVGIFEILTFPFGLPQDFEPLIEPEFPLQQSNSD